MVFKKFKKMIKKISTLLASATLAAGICSPFANAAAPGGEETGKYVGPVGIIRLDIDPENGNIRGLEDGETGGRPAFEVTKSNDYTYDAQYHKIIDNVKRFDLPDVPGSDKWQLYLRVSSSLTEKPDANDWVLWDGRTKEQTDANVNKEKRWMRADAGKYYIFYYIDGGANYNDYDGIDVAHGENNSSSYQGNVSEP